MKGLYAILLVALSLTLVGGCGKAQEERAQEEKIQEEKVQAEASPAGDEEGKGSSQPQEGILARVNGVSIHEKDVLPPGMPEEEKKMMRDRLLENAIRDELLYQEAKRMGLDRDPDYLKGLKQQEGRRKRQELGLLAGFYESTIPELKDVRDPKAIPEEEVEEYYQEHKKRYARVSKETARTSIRYLLAAQRHAKIRKEWQKKILRKAKVKVNGETLSSQALVASLEAMRPRPGVRPGRVSPLMAEVKEMVIKQEAKRRKVSKEEIEKDEKLVEELWAKAVISFDKEQLTVGEMRGGPGRVYALPQMLTTHLIAAEAKKKGLDKDPQYLAQKRMGESRFAPEGGKRSLLISILQKREGINDFQRIEVSWAEIDDYYRKNERRYRRMGREKAEISIRRTLQRRKAREKWQDFADGLRAKAKVEIVYRSKGD